MCNQNPYATYGHIEKYERSIAGKLFAHNLTFNDDWESIVDCLSETVAPTLCLTVAYYQKFNKFLNWQEAKSMIK